MRQTLQTPAFWCFWLVWGLAGAAGIATVTLSTTFGTARGLTLEQAVLILTAFNVTNGASRLIAGYLSDMMGRRLTMGLTFAATGLVKRKYAGCIPVSCKQTGSFSDRPYCRSTRKQRAKSPCTGQKTFREFRPPRFY
jgi:MFS family permease